MSQLQIEPAQAPREAAKPGGAEAAKLGERLRTLRAQHGWTLEDFAKRSGLSKSYLSRVEDGERQPSLAALLSLSQALGVPLASLFAAPPEARGTVTRARSAPVQEGNGLRYVSLSRGAHPAQMQPIKVMVPAGREGDALYQHDGEEWLYVLRGSLRLTLTEDAYDLAPGDAAHFDARLPHRLAALGGEDAEIILVACAAPRALLSSYL